MDSENIGTIAVAAKSSKHAKALRIIANAMHMLLLHKSLQKYRGWRNNLFFDMRASIGYPFLYTKHYFCIICIQEWNFVLT